MELTAISFSKLSHGVYFIIDCELFGFVPDWPNASRTGYIGDSHLKKAFEKYDAKALQRERGGYSE
jgi:hypothetical protein